MNSKDVIKIRSINRGIIFTIVYGIAFTMYIAFTTYNNDYGLLFFLIPFSLLIMIYNVLSSLNTVIFYKDSFQMKGSLLFRKLQTSDKITYQAIDDATFDTIDFKSFISSEKRYKQQIMFGLRMSRYSNIKCITFNMLNGNKHHLVINQYTEKQIQDIIDQLKIHHITFDQKVSEDTFIHHHSNDRNEPFKQKKIKYPVILGILTTLGMIIFFLFFYYSTKHGGSAISDLEAQTYENYISGSYYLRSHGVFTEVSYEVWNNLRMFEPIMWGSFMLMFISNFIYVIVSNKKLKKD